MYIIYIYDTMGYQQMSITYIIKRYMFSTSDAIRI